MGTLDPDRLRLDHVQALARKALSQTTLDRYAPAFAKMYSDPDRRAQAWRALLDREKQQLEIIANNATRSEPERAQARMRLTLFENQQKVHAEIEPPAETCLDGTPVTSGEHAATTAVQPRSESASTAPTVLDDPDETARAPRPGARRPEHAATNGSKASAGRAKKPADRGRRLDHVGVGPGPAGDSFEGWPTGKSWTPDAIFDPRLGLDGLTRLVYVYLCGRANQNGEAWPTMRRVAMETGIGDRKVRQAVAALRRAGLIEHKPRTHNFRILGPAAWPSPAGPSTASRAAEPSNGSAWPSPPGFSAPRADVSASGAA
jgi:helix-turn-helix protein